MSLIYRSFCGDFPGDPVVKTLGFQCRGGGAQGRGTKIPYAVWPRKRSFISANITECPLLKCDEQFIC